MNIYALIKDGIIINTIVADDTFINHIDDQYDHCVPIDNSPGSPGIGWSYDGSTFSPPVSDE